MQARELRDKLQQIVDLSKEVIEELGQGNNASVLMNEVYTNTTNNVHIVNQVLGTVIETESAAKDPEIKANLPKKAPSPASKVEKSGT